MTTVDVLLDEKRLTVEKLAERAGMLVDRTLAICEGRWTPSPSERERLASALGMSVDQISWGHTMNQRNQRYHRFGLPEDF